MNTAHQGGRLVHELGVRAMMASATGTVPNPGTETKKSKRSDDDDD